MSTPTRAFSTSIVLLGHTEADSMQLQTDAAGYQHVFHKA